MNEFKISCHTIKTVLPTWDYMTHKITTCITAINVHVPNEK